MACLNCPIVFVDNVLKSFNYLLGLGAHTGVYLQAVLHELDCVFWRLLWHPAVTESGWSGFCDLPMHLQADRQTKAETHFTMLGILLACLPEAPCFGIAVSPEEGAVQQSSTVGTEWPAWLVLQQQV